MAITRKDVFSLFWILGLIFFLRAYVFEPFQIPTGSMIPTLLIGDHLLVSKSAYDITLPLSQKSLLRISDPMPSDVVVFEYPNFEHEKRKQGYSYIKRVVGIPGDLIKISKGVLAINGTQVVQKGVEDSSAEAQSVPNFKVLPHASLYQEFLISNKAHWIQKYPSNYERYLDDLPRFKADTQKPCVEVGTFIVDQKLAFYRSIAANEICEFKVPKDQYFVMGDNRDDSEDGRYWGFVDRSKIKGKALLIFMAKGQGGLWQGSNNLNPDPEASYFNWKRFGLKIK